VPEFVVERAAQIGFATQIFWRSGMLPSQSWLIPVFVPPAIALRQVAFDFDVHGVPRALIAWAYLTETVSAELTANPWRELHVSEWNEGTELWIVALLGSPDGACRLLRRMLRGRLSGFSRVRGFQRNPDGSIKRLRDRSRTASPAMLRASA
jgi:hemolysin-activating ACP:hemolysin acyltransferase